VTEASIVTHKSEEIQEIFRYEESALNKLARCSTVSRLSKKLRGFTLIELIITVAVLAILLTIGVPSFRDVLDRRRVTNATTTLLSQVQQARSFSILLNRSVVMEFKGTSTDWCFGVTDKSSCDCTVTSLTAVNSCSIGRPAAPTDTILLTGSSKSYPNVSLGWEQDGTGTYEAFAGKRIVFEPTRGLATGDLPGTYFEFSSLQTDRKTQVKFNPTGKVSCVLLMNNCWEG
jgi:prepilin-type N-terminal cleavage/methylation domain-containing protein